MSDSRMHRFWWMRTRRTSSVSTRETPFPIVCCSSKVRTSCDTPPFNCTIMTAFLLSQDKFSIFGDQIHFLSSTIHRRMGFRPSHHRVLVHLLRPHDITHAFAADNTSPPLLAAHQSMRQAWAHTSTPPTVDHPSPAIHTVLVCQGFTLDTPSMDLLTSACNSLDECGSLSVIEMDEWLGIPAAINIASEFISGSFGGKVLVSVTDSHWHMHSQVHATCDAVGLVVTYSKHVIRSRQLPRWPFPFSRASMWISGQRTTLCSCR